MAGSPSFWQSAKRWMRSLAEPQPRDDDEDDEDAPSLPPWTSGEPLASGGEIGGYRVDRVLARGAVGTLYAAVDPITGEPVAIKTLMLASEAIDPAEARRRFLHEAQTACRLQHPDIVTVHGAGESGGVGFIVMELLSGNDLTRYTRPALLLPEPVVLRIVARVADALAYAHTQGVVHRDVKPANVMVHLPTHQVKVTDFGIAKVVDASHTRTGFVLGTPAFMSPEQLAGARLDGRSDLYALGVMLFQLLSARLPYEGASMGELLRRIAGEPPLELAAVRPDLPQALAEVVALALEKRPERRYADGRRLAEDLRLIASQLDAAAHRG